MLSDTNKLNIIFALEKEPLSVSKIIEITGLSQPLVSFHLKTLREAELVKTNRKATFVFNELCDSELPALIRKFEKYGTNTPNADSSFPFPCAPCRRS